MASFKIFAVLSVAFLQSFHVKGDPRSELARMNYFDVDLLRYCAEERSGNVLVSPASIKCTLGMLLEGSRGATEAELRGALRLLPGRDDFRDQLHTYMESLSVNSPSVLLQNANSIFASKKLKMFKDFEKHAKTTYNTDVFKVDFSNPVREAAHINQWVANKTAGLINNVIEPAHLDPYTEILLTNAIYFKANWLKAFDSKFSRRGCFYIKDACNNVTMMELSAELKYAHIEELRAHALELPYEGGRYSMILLVPLDRDGCPTLIRDLPYMNLVEISKLFQPTDVDLAMPKFSIDYGEELAEPLKSMRVNSLFSSSPNLTGIFEGASPHINSLYHKVHMSVDEQGTIAAAASAAMGVPRIGNRVTLVVNKPFLFFIRDNKLGVVLFEGRVEEPTPYIDDVKVPPHKEQIAKKQPFRH